ncbi:MAG TPA: methyltransferase domain-containing protein [Bryobacterales bacterium]|nr:methyltransferase domain-containing protein [Bryobacterales bacterium]
MKTEWNPELLEQMRRDWDERARENARHFVATGKQDWSDEEFFRSGEAHVREQILNDMINICQSKDPREMRVLEIGCGAGRVTRALAQVFGRVDGVDVSGEMVARAQEALRDFPGTSAHQNNGVDLRMFSGEEFDFAFSSIVFQHIPSKAVIENYVGEVRRVLKPGALFKFQAQGVPSEERHCDTWLGVGFTDREMRAMAERQGFEMRYAHGAGTQYFWLWFFKRTEQGAEPK